MRASLVAGIAAAVAVIGPAHADFVLTSPSPPLAAMPASANQSHTAHAARPRQSRPSRFAVASGFGDEIPLSFAVRQIVPHAVKVTYGPGANPGAPVDWQGGAAWNQVLARAVRPLGLHLVMTWMAVEIRK